MHPRSQLGLSRIARLRFLGTLCAGVLLAAAGLSGAHASGTRTATASIEAAGAASPSCSSVKTGGSLNFGVAADSVGFDPSMTQDVQSLSVDLNIFDQLVRIKGTGLQPDLATSWQMKNGGRTIVFHLRHDARFYDGTPVTASDVKFSFDHVSRKDAIVNWTLSAMKSNRVIDKYTFEVTLSKPWAPFMQDLTLWGASILSQKAFEKLGDKFKEQPVGSGPFYISEWVRGQYIQLKRNPYYWGKDACGHSLPYLDSIKLVLVPDDSTRVVKLQSGSLDAILNVPFNIVDSLSKSKGVQGVTTPSANFIHYALNQSFAPFTDHHVVAAMNMALDRDAIVKAVLHGHGVALQSPYGKDLLYWTGAYGYHYDLDKAKAELAKSKYADGFKFTVLTVSGDAVGSAVAVIMQNELKELGIDMTIQPLDATTEFGTWSKEKYQMAVGAGTAQTLDPDSNMLFCCISWGGADSDYTHWKDPQVDAIFSKTQTAVDPTQRKKLYQQFQKLVMERGPHIWLIGPNNSFGIRTDVHGVTIDVNAHWPLWQVWKG